MKHCEKCGNIIKPGYIFCTSCGAKQKTISDLEEKVPDYIISKYTNLMVRGVFKNCLVLTPFGIHMFRNSIMFPKYNKLIHFSEIKGIEYRKPTILNNGYLSIITNNCGVSGLVPPYSSRDNVLFKQDENTILCRFSSRAMLEQIYYAINDICYQLENAFQETVQYDDFTYDNQDQYIDINNQESSCFIDGMNGHEFEYFCADLLRNNGFSDVSVTPGSGDQGVDILAQKDGIKYAIQCKNYSSNLSNTPIQEVNAGKIYYRCHVGVVMTNSFFTPSAVQLAEATGVLLWNRDHVLEMIRNVNMLLAGKNSDEGKEAFEESFLAVDEMETVFSEAEIPIEGNIDSDEKKERNVNELDAKTDEVELFFANINTFSEESDSTTIQEIEQNQKYKDKTERDNTLQKVQIDPIIDNIRFVNASIKTQKNENRVEPLKEYRKSMLAWMIIFLVLAFPCIFSFAFVLVLGKLYIKEFAGIAFFFVVLAGMFFVLSKSPKNNPYILGKSKGLKKTLFVFLCIVLALTICTLSFDIERVSQTQSQFSSLKKEETSAVKMGLNTKLELTNRCICDGLSGT